MTTQEFCDARDLDQEMNEAMSDYEEWQLSLPRLPVREWSDAEIDALLPVPF